MTLRLPVVLEVDDFALAQLREALANDHAPPAAPSAARPTVSANVSLPATWHLVEELEGVTYTWGEEQDVYDPFRIYEGTTAGVTVRLSIGECKRTGVRGRDRKYFITHHIGPAGGKRAVAEFLETDDYAETGDLIAIIKGKGGGGKLYDPTDRLPAAYEPYRIELYRDRIDYPGSYYKLGLVVSELDYETMLNHSLIQVQTRGLDG